MADSDKAEIKRLRELIREARLIIISRMGDAKVSEETLRKQAAWMQNTANLAKIQ